MVLVDDWIQSVLKHFLEKATFECVLHKLLFRDLAVPVRVNCFPVAGCHQQFANFFSTLHRKVNKDNMSRERAMLLVKANHLMSVTQAITRSSFWSISAIRNRSTTISLGNDSQGIYVVIKVLDIFAIPC